MPGLAEVWAGQCQPWPGEDTAPQSLLRPGQPHSPLVFSFYFYIPVLPTKQSPVPPVLAAIGKQIKSFHQLFLIEADKAG